MYASLRIFEVRRAWAPAGAGVTNSLAAVMDKLRSSGVASTFGGHKVPTLRKIGDTFNAPSARITAR